MGALWTEVRMAQNQFQTAFTQLLRCFGCPLSLTGCCVSYNDIWRKKLLQVLIKRWAKLPRVELILEFMTLRVEKTLSQWDWYLWTKRLSRSICQHLSLSFVWSSLHVPASGYLWDGGEERVDEALFHPSRYDVPQGVWVGLWSCVSHDRDTSNPVRR